LGLMVDEGTITEAEATAAAQDDLQFAAIPFPIDAPHFVMAVWTQLERDYPEYIYGGGLEVITTVDLDWTNAAQDIVQRQLDALNHPIAEGRPSANAHNAALVAIDPYTGQVLTMLGSPDYFDEDIDGAVNAAVASRQPGSALKPFTYAAAMNPELDDPYTAATMLLDVETPFVTRRLESYTPANYALVEHGPVSAREALASSYNIPAVVALDHAGIDNMIQLAAGAGLQSLTENPNLDLAVTLGGGEVRLLDMAQAYSIYPNGGYRIEPSFILRIATPEGEILYEWQQPELETRILDERIAYIISDILSDDDARMPAFGRYSALSIGRPAAAKTGTTTDFKDNWVLGYTPNLVVGVWVGNADNTPMVDITGLSGAGPIWNQFMRRVLRGQPELEFERPAGILNAEVCALSGLLPTNACQLTRLELFIPGTVPTEEDNLYQAFVIDRDTGLLADEDTPRERRMEQVFIVLPQEAQDWGIRHGIRQPPLGAVVKLTDTNEGVRILYPDPYSVFQISLVTPIETQRLRFRAAAPEGTVSMTYRLNDEVLATLTEAPYEYWWTLELGGFQLAATATLDDGSTETSAITYFTVTEYEPPATHNLGE
jgi:membrane peptidoglycan carboxypeptidase